MIFRCFTKSRPNGVNKIIYAIFVIMIFCQMESTYSIDLLFVEKKFNWTVTDYTNFMRYRMNVNSYIFLFLRYHFWKYLIKSFYVGMVVIRTFITTPFYCYFLKMHDCMVTITAILVTIDSLIVKVRNIY